MPLTRSVVVLTLSGDGGGRRRSWWPSRPANHAAARLERVAVRRARGGCGTVDAGRGDRGFEGSGSEARRGEVALLREKGGGGEVEKEKKGGETSRGRRACSVADGRHVGRGMGKSCEPGWLAGLQTRELFLRVERWQDKDVGSGFFTYTI